MLGVLALGAGLIARSNLLIVAGVIYLLAGISRGWGVNRGRRRRRAWTNRLLAVVAAVLVGFFIVFRRSSRSTCSPSLVHRSIRRRWGWRTRA